MEEAVGTGEASGLRFRTPEVLERVADLGDLFAPAATLRQRLPDLAFDDAKSTRIVRA